MSARPKQRGFGRWTRFGLLTQVLLLSALSVVFAVIAIELASVRGLRWRLDLTATGKNTLDAETVRIFEAATENLEEDGPLRIDFFPRADTHDLALSTLVNDRVSEFLLVLEETLDDALVVDWYDPLDVERTRARMAELGLTNVDAKLVLSRGGRKHVLRVYQDLVDLDYGSSTGPTPTTGRIVAFRAEEALLAALAQVVERPLVVFTQKSGEPGLGESGLGAGSSGSLDSLAQALVAEGFRVLGWDPHQGEPLPEETSVVAVVAPRQALGEDVVQSLVEWVDGGGRIVGVLGPEVLHDATGEPAPGTLEELLATFGVESKPGLVCLPVLQVGMGLVDGVRMCATLELGARSRSFSTVHPITTPLAQSDIRVRLDRSHAFARGTPRHTAPVLDLLTTPREAWLDLPDTEGRHDYALDQRVGEEVGGFRLAMATAFQVESEGEDEVEREGRLVAIAAPYLFDAADFATYNRDFALNVFQWLAERESHVRVRPRDAGQSRIEVLRGPNMARFRAVALWGMPGACLVTWLLLTWRRRS